MLPNNVLASHLDEFRLCCWIS